MTELSASEKRDLIYIGERINAIAQERIALENELSLLQGDPKLLSEPEKRRRIYMRVRLERLKTERDEAVEQRRAFSARIGA